MAGILSSWFQKGSDGSSASGSGSGGHFSVGEISENPDNLTLGAGSFRLFHGLGGKKQKISVFSGDQGDAGAQNGLKRIKTLRHPSVVTFLDSSEVSGKLNVATEAVRPLLDHLADVPEGLDEYKAWGVMQVCIIDSHIM